VIIEFRTVGLRKCYEENSRAVRRWGDGIARRYVGRIDILYAAQSVADLHKIPQLKLHALKGNRSGQFAIHLDGFMRLIVSFDAKHDDVIWIEEVSKHYAD